MNKLGLHFQFIPDWTKRAHAENRVRLRFVKLIDPPSENPFPGALVIGRTYVEDNYSNALVMAAEAGAETWFAMHREQYERAKYVEAWCGPNEPPVGNAAQRQALNRFTVRFNQLMHAHGYKTVVLNCSVTWPMDGTARDFVRAVQGGDYLGLHEYGRPTMMDGAGDFCLHYREVVAELLAAGLTKPPKVIIGECGIDDGQRHGWKTFAKTEDEYIRQLLWYAREINKDAYVVAAFVFTAGPSGWNDFEVTESLSGRIAALDVPDLIGPPAPVGEDEFVTRLKTRFGQSYIDARNKLTRSSSKTYPVRALKTLTRVIVHHDAVAAKKDLDALSRAQAIARYHVTAQDRLYPGPGYHFLIAPDGVVAQMNDLSTASWHCANNNADSIGVCFAGNFMTQLPTTAALLSFATLAQEIDAFLGRDLGLFGHRDINKTTVCPGDNLYAALFEQVKEPLPERERVFDEAKRIWYIEEAIRMIEQGNTKRAREILLSWVRAARKK